MHKAQEGANVKALYDFGNDPMKNCFKQKIRMKVDHKLKILIVCFYHVYCDF
jgi:hypothetical protein